MFALDDKTGQVRWKSSLGASGLTTPGMAEEAGLVLVGDSGGILHALDRKSGEERFRFATDGGILAAPVADDEAAYVISSDRNLYAIRLRDGKRRWRHALGATAIAGPVIAEDRIVLATLDNVLHGIRAKNGFREWKVLLDRRVVTRIQEVDDVIYVTPADSSSVLGFMAKNGYALGNISIPGQSDYSVGRAHAGTESIYLATYGRTLSRYKRITSRQVEDGEEELPDSALPDPRLGTQNTRILHRPVRLTKVDSLV